MIRPAAPDTPPAVRRAGARGLQGWHRLAGPFWPYVGATPFISPYVPRGPAPEPRRITPRIGRLLVPAANGLVAVIIDQSARPVLAMAASLAAAGFWVAPLIQRWLVAGGVLPAEPLAGLLHPPPLRPASCRDPLGVVFILDGERTGRPSMLDRRYHPRRFDNRYEYTPHVFPPPGFLAGHGVAEVRVLTRAGRLIPDLARYVRDLAAAGLMPESAP